MTQTNYKNQKKYGQIDPNRAIESLKTSPPSSTNGVRLNSNNFGAGIFDQLINGYSQDDFEVRSSLIKEKTTTPTKPTVTVRKEFSLFNYQHYHEKEIVKRQIQELVTQIRQEISLIKKADSTLVTEVRDLEKITLESLPEKPGIYHIRFLEIILKLLQSIRAKINESKTWLEAMISKRKKRGSLFMALSKKKGTQYSLSQELSNARSVQ